MVASSADDGELRRACAAAIGGAGSKQDIVLAIRVAKGRGILEKLGRVAKPRVLALTGTRSLFSPEFHSFFVFWGRLSWLLVAGTI